MIFGLEAWRGQWCPKWLGVVAIIVGVVSFPSLDTVIPLPFLVTYYSVNALTVLWVVGIGSRVRRRDTFSSIAG